MKKVMGYFHSLSGIVNVVGSSWMLNSKMSLLGEGSSESLEVIHTTIKGEIWVYRGFSIRKSKTRKKRTERIEISASLLESWGRLAGS